MTLTPEPAPHSYNPGPALRALEIAQLLQQIEWAIDHGRAAFREEHLPPYPEAAAMRWEDKEAWRDLERQNTRQFMESEFFIHLKTRRTRLRKELISLQFGGIN